MTKPNAALDLAAALDDLKREQSDANLARIAAAVAILSAPDAAPEAKGDAP